MERALKLGSALPDSVRRRTDEENPRELPLSMQFNLGESAVWWFSNARNNFAPFAGFMLRGLREERLSMESAGEEIDQAIEKMRAGGETVGNKFDDVSL